MAVESFPRAWIDLPVVEAEVNLIRRQSIGAVPDRDFSIDRGQPQWVGKWKTVPLTDAQVGQARSFFKTLRGAARNFLMYDPFRAYPLAYKCGWPIGMLRHDGSSWDGTATLASIADSAIGTRDVIGLSGLPADFIFTTDDYLSVLWGTDRYSLHSVLDASLIYADASGGATLWVEPELPDGITVGATVNLAKPCAKWFIPPGQLPSITPAAGRRPYTTDCTFQALSTLV